MHLSPAVHAKFGSLPNLKVHSRRQKSFSSSCPWCGGTDRFIIWDNERPRYWCSVCNRQGWLDDKVTPEEITAAIQRNQERQEERLVRESALVKRLQEEAYWQGWHDRDAQLREDKWLARGVKPDSQNYWNLGYTHRCPHVPYPALTIPYKNNSGDVRTIQYRMDSDDAPMRYAATPDVMTPAFWTMPDVDPSAQPLLLLEGAIKGMVSAQELLFEANMPLAILSLPNATPESRVIAEIADLNWPRVYMATDPDTFQPDRSGHVRAQRIGAAFGERARYVQLPDKIDDLIFLSGWTARDINLYINQATREL